jgi:hypothetical protein
VSEYDVLNGGDGESGERHHQSQINPASNGMARRDLFNLIWVSSRECQDLVPEFGLGNRWSAWGHLDSGEWMCPKLVRSPYVMCLSESRILSRVFSQARCQGESSLAVLRRPRRKRQPGGLPPLVTPPPSNQAVTLHSARICV